MPHDTPAANLAESVVAGARVVLVRGLISDCGALVRRGCEQFSWFDLSTLKEPFRLEGKKTLGYELALDLAAAEGSPQPLLPDVIVYPAGGGTGLIGMWKAFDEMQALGWIGPQRPRMVLVQAAGCDPIVRAWEAGSDDAPPLPSAATVASGLRVPSAVGDFLMLRAVRASRGIALRVTDEELLAAARQLATEHGIFAAPEGGAAWHAAQQLAAKGWIGPRESVVVFNTGSGLKYLEQFPLPDLPLVDAHDTQALSQFA
jgi:threonine synthase